MNKPYIDISSLAFASDEEQKKVMEKYTDDLTEYIKLQLSKKKKIILNRWVCVSATVLYIAVTILQLCFFVPSTHYEVYISSQKVPHKITTMTTYGRIKDADKSFTRLNVTGNKPNIEGKELNTGRFFWQIVLTTIIYAAICYAVYKFSFEKEIDNKNENKAEQLSLFDEGATL